jgi:hypothetical protein
MNQIMVNAVEFESLLKEVEYFANSGQPSTVQVVGVKRKPTAYPEVCWPQDEPAS